MWAVYGQNTGKANNIRSFLDGSVPASGKLVAVGLKITYTEIG